MIRLAFTTITRKIIQFSVDAKVVKYFDDNWKDGLQVYPLDKLLVRQMQLSRKQNIQQYADLILKSNQGKDLEDYNNCKTDEEIADFIRKDCKTQGLKEL